MDTVSLSWKSLLSCAQEKGGQTLISFVVPNPNPDNDLTAPQIWVGEQGVGSASLGPMPVLSVALGSLSSSQEGLKSQDPA